MVLLWRHRNVASLEIYNEENVRQWWDGTVDQYVAVLERGMSRDSASRATLAG